MATQQGMSEDTKTIIAVILLVTVFPIGVIYMWFAPKWPKWLKLIITIPALGIPFILLAITLIAINPSRQFAQANDTKRAADINAIVNAVYQYQSDNMEFPQEITESPTPISKSGVDLCDDLVPNYLAALPTDPKSPTQGAVVLDCTTDYTTEYVISKDASGQITVSAPLTERTPQEVTTTR
jgi:type II secretory pathway pseudopilin PulG